MIKSNWIMVDISNVMYNASKSTASFEIHQPGEPNSQLLSSAGVIFFKISTTSNDVREVHIADISILEYHHDNIAKALSKHGYGFDGSKCPEKLFHLHAEASLVLDIFSTEAFSLTEINTK